MTEAHAPPSNRRRSFRAEVEGCALLHTPSGTVRCRVADLGLGGVRLDGGRVSDDNVAPGLDVTLELECAGAGWVVQRGRVLRQNAGQIAIVFDALAPEVEDLIEDELLGAVEALLAPRVVVVDGDPHRRNRAAAILQNERCLPLCASTPLEAVALVERSRNHVRAVLVAEALTQTQADELARFLADEHPTVEVLRQDADEHALRALAARLRPH